MDPNSQYRFEKRLFSKLGTARYLFEKYDDLADRLVVITQFIYGNLLPAEAVSGEVLVTARGLGADSEGVLLRVRGTYGEDEDVTEWHFTWLTSFLESTRSGKISYRIRRERSIASDMPEFLLPSLAMPQVRVTSVDFGLERFRSKRFSSLLGIAPALSSMMDISISQKVAKVSLERYGDAQMGELPAASSEEGRLLAEFLKMVGGR